jgi:predicted signal transduction protein with EAL and GGDEF domain
LELPDLALAERANGDWATFALIELDGMEDVTAHRGVLGSDEVIVAAAKRLKAVLPSYATCGRIASDAFAIILTAAPEVNVEMIIRAALESISHSHWINNVARVSAHAGFAQPPRHAATRGELTRRTNLALRAAAKKVPGSIVTFDLSIDAISNDQKFIHRELRGAISAPMSWPCTISRLCHLSAGAWSASKPCCAGRMQHEAQFRRPPSFRWPSKWA